MTFAGVGARVRSEVGLEAEASVEAGGALGAAGSNAFEVFGVGGGGEVGDLSPRCGDLTLEQARLG